MPKTVFDDTPAGRFREGVLDLLKKKSVATPAPKPSEKPRMSLGQEINSNIKAARSRKGLAEKMGGSGK
jgi:hypothetical protein